MGDRSRQLSQGRQSSDARQLHLHLAQSLFGSLTFGDVPPDTPVADEAPRLVKHRQPRHGDVALAAVGRRPHELEITEREVGIECLPVLAPGLCVRLQVRHFPARLTDLGARHRRVGKPLRELLAGKAMLRVALPVHVEGELHEGAKALLALPQRFFGPLALGQIQYVRDTLVSFLVERGGADQHGDTAAILAEVLLFIGLRGSGHLQLGLPQCVAVAPVRRRQSRTVDATRDEILAVVSHHSQKRVVGRDHLTVESSR